MSDCPRSEEKCYGFCEYFLLFLQSISFLIRTVSITIIKVLLNQGSIANTGDCVKQRGSWLRFTSVNSQGGFKCWSNVSQFNLETSNLDGMGSYFWLWIAFILMMYFVNWVRKKAKCHPHYCDPLLFKQHLVRYLCHVIYLSLIR